MKLGFLFFLLFITISCGVKVPEEINLFDENKRIGIIINDEGISTYMMNSSATSAMFGMVGVLILQSGNGYEATERKRFSESLKVVENRLNVKNLFLQTYKTIYKKKDIDIIEIKGKLTLEYLDSFKKPRSSKKKHSKYDFRFIKDKYNVDQLIFADVKYGLLLNNKNGICEIITRVIDLDDNALLHIDSSLGEIDVDGKWNTPPDYDNLYKAVRKAIENAILLEKIKFR